MFIVSLVGAGGMMLWEKNLLDNQITLKADLDKRKQQFNPELIDFLKRKNLKIDTAKSLLNNHIAVSDVFGVISRLTIENVRFKSFDYIAPLTEKDEPKVSLKGDGASFSAIAFQADVLGKDKVLKNPILSDLSLESNGHVSFSLVGSISTSDILYTKSLLQRSGGASASQDTAPASSASSDTTTSGAAGLPSDVEPTPNN